MANRYMTVIGQGSLEEAMRAAITMEDYDFIGIVSHNPNFDRRIEYHCRSMLCKDKLDFQAKCKAEWKMFFYRDVEELKAAAETLPEALQLEKVGLIFVEDVNMADYLAETYRPQM